MSQGQAKHETVEQCLVLQCLVGSCRSRFSMELTHVLCVMLVVGGGRRGWCTAELFLWNVRDADKCSGNMETQKDGVTLGFCWMRWCSWQQTLRPRPPFFSLNNVADLLPTVGLIALQKRAEFKIFCSYLGGAAVTTVASQALTPQEARGGVCMSSLWLRGFPQGPPASSHSPAAFV